MCSSKKNSVQLNKYFPRCPDENWIDFDDLGCYHFGSEMFSNMSYFEAAYYCHRLGDWAGNGGILAEPIDSFRQGYKVNRFEIKAFVK